MKIEYYKEFSHELNRDMEYKVFGHGGKPCIVFPAQDGRFYDFENFGMVDAIKDYIDMGRIQLFCVDSIDGETFSNQYGDPRERLIQHERWFHYITNELVPRIKEINGYKFDRLMTTGCSMGAYHALNFMLRRPDLFDKVLGMSGLYHAGYFFKDYHDELTYRNSPIDSLPHMSFDHPYMDMYHNSEIILCCGQGAWEEQCEADLYAMKRVFEEKGIDAWIDFWGYDVNHDWPWWKKQIYYFLQFMV